ncbi:hypothetical protein [Devosia sediminis]|uniref:Uncharacterized protein n=1 Tax=Devosia sediminis TaxID=2798801 RepID=A0A934MN93_9HYPH|nr:hypothetical protein [Devosia sediminis]MBJ3786541.1 hypothetical protein [Devosia sediminis]
MEDIYRDHRISVRQAINHGNGFEAKIWTVQGNPTLLVAKASLDEGAATCLDRARKVIDQFITYRDQH